MESISLNSELTSLDLPKVNLLLKQLNQRLQLSERRLIDLQSNENVLAYCVARYGEEIVGFGILVQVFSIRAKSGLIKYVIVEESARNKKVGESIIKYLIEAARNKKVRFLSLITSEEREGANQFYQKMGFFPRKKNYYRLDIK
jgi:GNAT superfamily N-acetyltransferase